MEQLNLQLGRKLKRQGMAQAVQNERQQWVVDTLELLQFHADAKRGYEWPAENFRAVCAILGRPEPHSPHVWGALFNLAVKRGIIEWTGRYVQARSPRTHAHPVKVYKAV